MWVDVVGESARRCSPEVGEKLVFGVVRDDRKRELLEDGSGRGGRGNDSDGGFNDGGWKVLDRDVREGDTVDYFFELLVDVGVLGFVGGGVLKLRA